MDITPEIGMGATVCFYSDRKAATIVGISPSGRKVTVQYDKAIRSDDRGMSDSQEYSYQANPQGRTEEFTLRRNGRFVRVGETQRGGLGLLVGARHEYYDYSF